jgi:hypothetical protein
MIDSHDRAWRANLKSSGRARRNVKMRGMRPPRPSVGLIALVILGAAGLGLAAVGVVTAWGWRLFAPGIVAVLVCLAGVWLIFRSRDETLR